MSTSHSTLTSIRPMSMMLAIYHKELAYFIISELRIYPLAAAVTSKYDKLLSL